MLNSITTTVPTFSGSPLSLLNIPDTHSLSSTNNIPFQPNTKLNVTADPCQTLYQPHTVPNMGLSATLPSSSSFVSPINLSLAIIQNYTVLFVSLKKSVKTSDGLHHQYTPEKQLHQNDAHMIFTMGKQLLPPVAIKHWHKRHMYIFLYVESLRDFFANSQELEK